MTTAVAFQRFIPLRHFVDVFVAGGGPAGVAAATAAARQGCRVFLAEDHTCLGGMGTAGLVPAFCTFGDGKNVLAAGIGTEILERTKAARPNDFIRAEVIRIEPLKRVYDDLLTEAKVEFTFGTRLVAVETDGGRVTSAVLAAKSGLFAVEAKVYIDATGDGDLAVWAGAPAEKGDPAGALMPGSLCSLWADVDWDKVEQSDRKPQSCRLEEAFKNNVFTHEDRHLPGMYRVGQNLGCGNIGHTYGLDSTDERSVTEALIWGRKLVLEYDRYYRKYLEGFEDMELVATGSLLGVRESRRVMGDYVLDVEDFRQRASFDDEIGRYCYPVDIHPSKPDKEAYAQFEKEFQEDLRYGEGESYGIPYRTLTPQGLQNVLVTGRCVSTDRYVQGSIRVMPGCFITGQAAGVAAAIACEGEHDVRAFPVAELQKRLRDIGAYLPAAEPAKKPKLIIKKDA